jgi:hypothetical protein
MLEWVRKVTKAVNAIIEMEEILKDLSARISSLEKETMVIAAKVSILQDHALQKD